MATHRKLRNKYTDTNGLQVPDEEIIALFEKTGVKESDLESFLGQKRMSMRGQAYLLMTLLSAQDDFYQNRYL